MNQRSFALTVFYLLIFLPSAAIHAQPVISIRDTLFNLGEIYRDQKVTRTLTIRNFGNAALHIDNVTSPCVCATTQLMTYDISPGDSTRLSFTLNTSIIQGKVQKYIIVVSNDLEHRNFFIRYNANVISILTPTPPLLYFGEVFLNKDVSGALSLKNTSKKQVHILNVTSLSGKLKFSHLPQLLAPGDSASLTVGLNLGEAVTFKDEIRVEIDHKVQPVVRINVIAKGSDRK